VDIFDIIIAISAGDGLKKIWAQVALRKVVASTQKILLEAY